MKRIICIVIVLSIVMLLVYVCKNKFMENFESSDQAQSEGASEYGGWGFHPILDHQRKKLERKKHHKKGNGKCVEDIIIETEGRCHKIMGECPITSHPDIDKYVLKSSIPPPKDLSNYTKKSMLHPQVDMSNYMLKSKCQAQNIDLTEYIKKVDVPACPEGSRPRILGVPRATCNSRVAAAYEDGLKKGRMQARERIREERHVKREVKSMLGDFFGLFKSSEKARPTDAASQIGEGNFASVRNEKRDFCLTGNC